MEHGKHGDYLWLETPLIKIQEFLTLAPEAVMGKQVLIVAMDGMPVTDELKSMKKAWKAIGKLTLTEKIKRIQSLPNEQYDEWYILDKEPSVDSLERFVNDGLSLKAPQDILKEADPNLPKEVIEEFTVGLKDLQQAFWKSIEKVKPLSYVSDGERFTLVTKDAPLFDKIKSEVF